MRKIFMILSVLPVLFSCSHHSDSYTINLDLEGTEGKWVNLAGKVDREFVVFDSVLVEPGVPVAMTGSEDGIRTVFLLVEGSPGSVRLLLENAEYTIGGTLDDPVIETSSKAQRDLNDYNAGMASLEDRLAGIAEDYYTAKETGNPAAADSILQAYETVNAEIESLDSAYVAGHLSSAVSVLILRNSFYAYETDELETVLNALDPSLRQMDEWVYMYGIMEHQKEVAVGKPYKDFLLPAPDGELLSVSDVHQGNVLLIDFWASWCGPCRRSNPELVEIYNEYHDRGFEILGVSLDDDAENWKKAIENDGLTWYQISDLKGWKCEGSRLYGVPAIPHTVLVDRKGIIRAKKLHGPELKDTIESLL
jgi:peroxiredoxin